MAGGSQNNDDELITAINVTPLVDVVLVLLIILMVTASYIVSRAIPMELPSASTGQPDQPARTLTVSIDERSQLYVDAQPVADDALRGAVRRYVQSLSNRADARATIAADGRVPHSRFIQIIDVLRAESVTRFAINVRPEDLQR